MIIIPQCWTMMFVLSVYAYAVLSVYYGGKNYDPFSIL